MKLLIVLSVACSFAVALDRDVVAFDLEDQLGNRWESQKLVGTPYILIVADREGAQHSEQWGTEIGRRVPKRTPIIGCANFDGVPFFLHWFVQMQVRKRQLPAPLLFDWDGALFRRLGCKTGVPAILVVRSDGRIAFRYDGPLSTTAIDVVVGNVRSLLVDSER